MTLPGHLDFYTVVLFVHVLSVLLAFGAIFAYPVIDVTIRRIDLRALPTWNEVQVQLGRKLITPAAILVLISGIYMAVDRWKDAGSGWYSAAAVILIVIIGLGHGVLAPTERKMSVQGKADVASGAAERGEMSAEYEAMAGRVRLFGMLASVLVLAALVLMVWKPGA